MLVLTADLPPATLLGVLVYLTGSLYPALNGLASTAGAVVLRLVVALRRLGEAAAAPPPRRGTVVPAANTVTVRGLTHRWGEHAEPVLRDLDLDLRAGDHLCVVGPSGIGKSTLAALITGTLAPRAGTVHIGGVPVAHVNPGTSRSPRRRPTSSRAPSGRTWPCSTPTPTTTASPRPPRRWRATSSPAWAASTRRSATSTPPTANCSPWPASTPPTPPSSCSTRPPRT
ncbi:ATP-binding cassette domain-containing protein [Actinokineospora soli]|uniref:ATP-binding cassette domain-containing protein n=1 Tax=Actinokineospora soli TaxID=1048753 RepID=A0ABW2TK41_9PSEU